MTASHDRQQVRPRPVRTRTPGAGAKPGSRTRSTHGTSTAGPRGTTWSAHTCGVAFFRRDRALRELPPRWTPLRSTARRRGSRAEASLDPDWRQQLLRPGVGLGAGPHQWMFQRRRRRGTASPIGSGWPGPDQLNVTQRPGALHPRAGALPPRSPSRTAIRTLRHIAFETDAARIEIAGAQDNAAPVSAERLGGLRPARRAAPIPSIPRGSTASTCTWREGGDSLPDHEPLRRQFDDGVRACS